VCPSIIAVRSGYVEKRRQFAEVIAAAGVQLRGAAREQDIAERQYQAAIRDGRQLSRASLSSGKTASATRVWSATAIACLAELSSRVGGGGVEAQAASISTVPRPNETPDCLRKRRVISHIQLIWLLLSAARRESRRG